MQWLFLSLCLGHLLPVKLPLLCELLFYVFGLFGFGFHCLETLQALLLLRPLLSGGDSKYTRVTNLSSNLSPTFRKLRRSTFHCGLALSPENSCTRWSSPKPLSWKSLLLRIISFASYICFSKFLCGPKYWLASSPLMFCGPKSSCFLRFLRLRLR